MVKVLLAQLFPSMLNGINLGTVWRLREQADVLGHLESFGLVPSGLIHSHHDTVVHEGLADMLQEEIHHRGISRRQNQRGRFPLCWSHSCVHVGIFTHDLSWGSRPDARWGPTSLGMTDATKTSFVLPPL